MKKEFGGLTSNTQDFKSLNITISRYRHIYTINIDINVEGVEYVCLYMQQISMLTKEAEESFLSGENEIE